MGIFRVVYLIVILRIEMMVHNGMGVKSLLVNYLVFYV
jgi:hypothetical protein